MLSLLLVSGCSQSSDGAPIAESPGPVAPTATVAAPATPDATPAELARFYSQEVAWEDCGGTYRCTSVQVPLSYSDPDGEVIELQVIKRPADDPDQRIGSLLINPGGPGGSGIDYARAGRGAVSEAVLKRYDLVGFDPRGVGRSDPIECLSDRQKDRYVDANLDPETPEEAAEVIAISTQFGPRCQRRSPELLTEISTAAAARDMDILREVVGDEKLTYLGKSYGTALGTSYAEQFPGRVGRLVLDGAIDPTLSNTELSRGQAVAFDKALVRFAEWCVDESSCPLGDDPAAGVQRIADLLEDLEDQPMKAMPGRPLTSGQATTAVVGGLYSVDGWEGLVFALQDAFDGDGFALQAMSDWFVERGPSGRYLSNGTDALLAVNCIDRPDRLDPEATADLAQEWSQDAPVFGKVLAWGNLPCYYWPVPAVDAPHEVTVPGAPPIVVVGTVHDPATPYEWAVALADQLEQGVLVAYDGDGHTAYLSGSECVDRAVDAYLLDGVVPPDGIRCK